MVGCNVEISKTGWMQRRNLENHGVHDIGPNTSGIVPTIACNGLLHTRNGWFFRQSPDGAVFIVGPRALPTFLFVLDARARVDARERAKRRDVAIGNVTGPFGDLSQPIYSGKVSYSAICSMHKGCRLPKSGKQLEGQHTPL